MRSVSFKMVNLLRENKTTIERDDTGEGQVLITQRRHMDIVGILYVGIAVAVGYE